VDKFQLKISSLNEIKGKEKTLEASQKENVEGISFGLGAEEALFIKLIAS
jgi:hypothetical protein